MESHAKRRWPQSRVASIPDGWVRPSVVDNHESNLESRFGALESRAQTASSYDQLTAISSEAKVFDHQVKIEDVLSSALLRIMRGLDNKTFVATARQVKNDDPKWLRRVNLKDFINEELEMRYLLARLERMMNEEG